MAIPRSAAASASAAAMASRWATSALAGPSRAATVIVTRSLTFRVAARSASTSASASGPLGRGRIHRQGQRPCLPLSPVLDSLSRRGNSSASGRSTSGATATASAEAEKVETEAGEENGQLRLGAPQPGSRSQKIAQIEPRLSLTFTCTANDCGHRSTHEFSKRAYTKGIVLVQCPECKNRHLIADHIGWFKESTEEGKLRTVEDLLRAKGETVRTGRVNFDGDIEYDPAQ